MRINHNIAALNTYRQLNSASTAQGKSMEKLSSGLRINRAGDDAAGLAISEKMRGQVRGLEQASRNAQDGISMIQTAEGALNETHSMLQRMRELAVQSNNGTNTSDDLAEIQKEINQLNTEVDRVANKTEFNTKTLLDGSLGVQAADGTMAISDLTASGITASVSGVAAGETLTFTTTGTSITVAGTNSGVSQTLTVADTTAISAGTTLNFDSIGLELSFGSDANLSTANAGGSVSGGTIATSGTSLSFQIGANGGTTLDISIDDMRSSALGSTASNANVANLAAVNVTTQSFDDNIQVIDEAIKKVSAQRSSLGAWQNRLDHTINNLGTSSENLTAAESRIRDVDMAKEMMNQTKNSILSQAAQAMLAQSMQSPNGVLQLLR
ncbi:flagellin [Pseudalkalibacillus berkeleyi]|uniref:Flagellin n=1 Tax=Pseudalkalibacillus berkeleyi TaxID=1069813 RepID=A0ABS9H176_9BACL|nr:flagellin [Pseudalkalibacillus berkeleyi]MCF6138752.1 flagellin [Pseudalkalibacillus berkeleyi]